MKEHFKVEKPILHLNYFTICIKYIVLFVLLFLSSWIVIPLLTAGKRGRTVNTVSKFIFENAFVFAILIAVTIIGWFIHRAIKKYKYGEVFDINFEDSTGVLSIKTINLANNKEKTKSCLYKDISFVFHKKNDPLFGNQRILDIYHLELRVHDINIDRTAWCRHDNIEVLIKKIKSEHINAKDYS